MQSKRGGPGRGQGRKPIKEGWDTVTVSLRMTEAQRDKLALLGGAKWVRHRIDKAKSPNVEVQRDSGGIIAGGSAGTTGSAPYGQKGNSDATD